MQGIPTRFSRTPTTSIDVIGGDCILQKYTQYKPGSNVNLLPSCGPVWLSFNEVHPTEDETR